MEDDPPHDIAVTSVSGNALDCDSLLREAVEATLRRHRSPAARISVVLVDDTDMTYLNQRHLSRHEPTDVLAFDLRDELSDVHGDQSAADREAAGIEGPAIDGEIILSVDTAAREAQERGHACKAELALYAVHGTLHLLGYDDDREDSAAAMHEVEDEVLAAIGLGPVYRTDAR